MNILIASDIHGSAYYCEKLVERITEEKPERIFLLGDILYHGPRNDLPRDYCPKKVIGMLEPYASRIFCLRGNCESEVDGMVLKFPVDAEYAAIFSENTLLYLTHGHKIREDVKDMDCILINGHTHIPLCEDKDGYRHLNPGSVSIPKEGSRNSYMTFDGKKFLWKDVISGEIYMQYSVGEKTAFLPERK